MSKGKKECQSSRKIDSKGQVGGIIFGWNDYILVASLACYQDGIVIQEESKVDHKSFKILNLYNPYSNRKV